GASIDRWNPGAFDKATGTHPYDDALGRIRMAMKSGVIKGIIWHQGESDSKPEAAEDWLKKLEALIGRLREETKNDSLPFVAGQLGRYRENYQLINRPLDRLPGTVPRTAVVSSRGLQHNGDGTHFDAPSACRLGKRFAKSMRRLQRTPRLRPTLLLNPTSLISGTYTKHRKRLAPTTRTIEDSRRKFTKNSIA